MRLFHARLSILALVREIARIGGGRHKRRTGLGVATTACCMALSGCLAPTPAPAETDYVPVAAPPEETDRAPASPPPHLADLPNPVVTHEPRSATGNDTYTEFGRTFHILRTAEGYDRIGTASWYGAKFHGRRTSSGEAYDMYRLTAAHPTLPIPVYALVENLENGRSTIVRINDRGPFRAGRFIDLSYAAAVKLDMVERGTARVRVTVVGKPDAQPDGGGEVVSGRYFLQAGAFRERDLAYSLSDDLRRSVDADVFGDVRVVRTGDDPLYRVRIGPFSDRGKAVRVRALLTIHRGTVPQIIKEPTHQGVNMPASSSEMPPGRPSKTLRAKGLREVSP